MVCSAAILWLGMGCGEDIDPDYQCGTDSLRQANKTYAVFEKHKSLFNRYPHRISVIPGFLRDEKTGRRTETWGIVIIVDKKVDQDTLLPEDRIPDELEGVPVQIILVETVDMVKRFQWEGTATTHFDYMTNVASKYRDIFDEYPYDGVRIEFPEPASEPGK